MRTSIQIRYRVLRTVMLAGMVMLPVLFSGCAARYTGPFMDEQGVTIKVKAPGASRVQIAGTFNRWDPGTHALSGPDKKGWWSITLPLGPGRHEYLFLVDGTTWLPDPNALDRVDDGFGGRNASILIRPLQAPQVRTTEAKIEEAEQAIAQSSFGFETQRTLKEKTRQAHEAGLPAAEILGLLRKGLDSRTGGQSIALQLSLVAETLRRGLPVGTVLNKVHEGIAKGAAPDRVLSAAGEVRKNLELANMLAGEAVVLGIRFGTESDRTRLIMGLAAALGSGIPEQELRKIIAASAKQMAFSSFARLVETTVALRDAGMPEDVCIMTARLFISQRYTEKHMAYAEAELRSLRARGISWSDAFMKINTGSLPGGPEGTGPLITEPFAVDRAI